MRTVFTSFPHITCPLQLLPCFILFNFVTSSSLLLLHILLLLHTHIYTHIHKYFCNILNPFSVAYMYMFRVEHLGLDNLSGISSLRKANFSSLSSQWLVACGFSWRWGLQNFPVLACQTVLSLCRSCLGNYSIQILWVVCKALSSSKCSGPLALIVFSFSLPRRFLRLRYRSCVVDVSVVLRHPMVTFLHFYQLWISVIDSICCKQKLLWWRMRTTLICWYKNKYLEYS